MSTAGYGCPDCHGRLVRDNTAGRRFKCESCGEKIHEAVAEHTDLLEELAARDDAAGVIATALLETGGVRA